jgi:hypothetical protein
MLDDGHFFENEYTRMKIEDGILFVEYPSNLTITLQIAEKCVSDRLKFCKGKSYPMLADISNIKASQREAREYLSSEEGIKGITAGAFIVKSQFTRLLGTVFLSLNLNFNAKRPPAKLFVDKDDAKEWLKQYRVIGQI